MTPETFLREFGELSETRGGVRRLRQTVLNLAIRGRLTERRPSDGVASTVLADVEERRTALVAEKKASAPKPIKSNGTPFQAPPGWVWAPFGEATICRDGQRVPVSRALREHRKGNYDYYGASGVIDKIDDYLFDEPLLLIGEDGANLLNRSTPIAFIARGKYWVNNHAHVLDGHSEDYLRYIELFINATDLRPYVTGTAQPKMNQAKMNSIPVAVPPLPEQKRIVAKVDQLMALCDDLEERQKKKRATSVSLNKAALNAVVAAPDKKSFKSSWKRVQDHFEVLYDLPENVGELRQTILQLAVMGKLVRQDSRDEPAEAWVARAASRAAGNGKTRRKKSGTGEMPKPALELPVGWTWATFDTLGEFGRGKSKHRPRNDPKLFSRGTYPLVQTGDVARGQPVISTFTSKYNATGLAQSRLWPKGTMCITIAANIADTGVLGFDACFPDSVVGFIPDEEIGDPAYFEFFVRTVKDRLEDFAPSTAQKNINLTILEEVQIPVPPLRELRRIVAKAHQFMALCDDLEAKLKQTENDGQRLMQAVVENLVA